MKYLICLFTLLSFSAFSQDVILKKNGEKIDAKVIEITSTTIKYRSWTQSDGPIRNIAISEVKEIIYDDGSWEKFEGERPVEKEDPEERMAPPREKNNEYDLFSNGFGLDLILGPAFRSSSYQVYVPNIDPSTGWDLGGSYVTQTRSDLYGSLSLRIGSKWYFGAGEKWKPGLQVNWLRFGLYFDFSENPIYSLVAGPKTFSICNVGMANAFKFNDKLGMEVNLNGGYNLDIYPDNGQFTSGISTALEVKMRIKKFAVGLDYMHIFGLEDILNPGDTPSSYNNMCVSVGLKF